MYTVLVGGYERLNEQPVAAQSRIPFICLTDDPALKSESWRIVRVDPALPADSVRSARLLKLQGHAALADFDCTMYVDNSVLLECDPDAVFDQYLTGCTAAIPTHSFHATLAAEFEAVSQLRLDDVTRIEEQRAHYLAINPGIFEEHPYWSGIVLRDHRDAAVQAAMNQWTREVLRYTRRDQLSANMAFARVGFHPHRIDVDNHQSWFHSWPHSAERKNATRARSSDEMLDLRRAVASQHEKITALQTELARRTDEVSRQKDLIDAILVSTSWRVTAPLRALKRSQSGFADWLRKRREDGNARAIGLKPLAHRFADVLVSQARKWKRRGLGQSRAGRALIDLCHYPDDIRIINRIYAETFGRKPSLLRPSSLSEKIQSEKLFVRNAKRTMLADKLRVRDFVRSRLGQGVAFPEIHWTGTDLLAARDAVLPSRFLVKANHGSGFNIAVSDSADFDWNAAADKAGGWLKEDFSDRYAEWQYRWIPPTLFIEQFLGGPDGELPTDFRFWCFSGRVEFITVRADVHAKVRRSHFTRDFEPLPVMFGPVTEPYRDPPPRDLSRMIAAVETLAAGERFVRIDLYEGDPPIFGEITWSPGAGFERCDPPEWDRKFGMLWR